MLERLTIFIPKKPSRAESDAAVRLTTTAVAHYGQQPTGVTVMSLPGADVFPLAPSQPLERQIVIREGPNSALALQGTVGVPSLLITGPANDLTNQTRLLSNDISRLALPPTGRGVSDALNLRYPTLFETGVDIATLELEIPNNGDSQPTWRLYSVNKPVPMS